MTVDRVSLSFSSLQYFFPRRKTGEKSISHYWFLMGLNASADFLVGLFWQTGCPCTDGDSRAREQHSSQRGPLWGPCAELSCSMYSSMYTRHVACFRVALTAVTAQLCTWVGRREMSCVYPAALCVFLGEISKEDFRFIHKYKHTQGEVPGAAFLASDILSLTLIVATHSTPT